MEIQTIKIAPVSYTNTYPLLYGLQNFEFTDNIKIQTAIPSKLLEMLKNGICDVALLPIASLKVLKEFYFVGNIGIASENKVASVCLFSNSAIENIEKVYLDFHSRSSVKLAQWLFEHHWKKNVHYVNTENDNHINKLNSNEAAVIIGDRALENLSKFEFIYDLAEEWKSATGLPFVFARWVSLKKLNPIFISEFEKAQIQSLENIENVLKNYKTEFLNNKYDMKKYYTENIQYLLNQNHELAIHKFLTEID